MRRLNWYHRLRAPFGHSNHRRTRSSKQKPARGRRARFEPLEERTLLAVLTVNSPLDNNTPGDGLVTLREAIIAANADTTTDLGQTGSGVDTIQFEATVFATPQTISLVFGQIVIIESVTINGPGRDVLTIDAHLSSRVFDVPLTVADISISGISLVNGRASGDGGAIRSQANGTLSIDDCKISGNSATDRGGGVYSRYALTVTHSIISGNSTTGADKNGGGLFVRGQGGGHNGLLSITNSIISGNTASGSGGGFYSHFYSIINDTTFSNNAAAKRGGGFALYFSTTTASPPRNIRATIVGSTFTNNSAGVSGGGFSSAFVEATDTQFTNNSTLGFGGGFAAPAQRGSLAESSISGAVTLVDCTVTGNTAGATGGGFFAGNVSTLTNTVVSQNMGGGIHSSRGTTLNVSSVTNNSGNGPGGGIFAPGVYHALGVRYYQGGPVVLNSSTVTGNKSGDAGGGIYARDLVELHNSTVSDNEATGDGGGIFVRTTIQFNRHSFFQFIHGTATLNSSTVSGNDSGGKGGGLSARFANVTTSTISGNTAVTGAGIYSHKDATVTSSTITGNQATGGAGGGLWNGDPEILAGQFPLSSTIAISRTILAANIATGGSPDLRPGGGSLTVTQSLIGDNAGSTLLESQTIDSNGNLIGSSTGAGTINPRLAPLADNGGPTKTHALLATSPAIDAIAFAQSGAVAAHEYSLDNSLADALGGPSLVALGGTLTATGYDFAANQGLNLSSALANPGHYTLSMTFQWDTLSGGWQKIIDFHNLTSNTGLYTASDGLHFIDGAFTARVFTPNTPRNLVITRNDATDIVRAYVNRALVWEFRDVAGSAVFDGPNQIMRFFQDDTVTAQAEAQSGIVDFIRIFDTVLTPTQVSSLGGPAILTYDQRGAPFLRARDGDGDGSLFIDIGAFELQGSPPALLDYGDAPDSGAGTGPGNYNTTASDNGPRHTIVPGLRIGANVDADSGSLQNTGANADDVDGALPDDEDGVSIPTADLVITVGANEAAPNFTLFDVPGQSRTVPHDINDLGQIVGFSGPLGFLKDRASFTTFVAPGPHDTVFTGINNSGVIAGNNTNGAISRGFVKSDSNYTHLNVPGFESTIAQGINNAGQVVGFYENVETPNDRGFLWDGNTYRTINMPLFDTISTTPRDINDAGEIVGSFKDSRAISHGFIRNSSGYTQFDVPGAEYTWPYGINNDGQIVGTWYNSTTGESHAFLKTGSTYTNIDVPGMDGTVASSINNLGQVVGWYYDSPDYIGGFIYTPKAVVLQPTVNVRVTNTTGALATLYGWIDYNGNGVFDNEAERASVAVPNGTNNDIVTIVFPTVPGGFTGTTYARFRLSTDTAAANPFGPASDGEVEDYRVTINAPSKGTADSAKTKKIAAGTNGGPALVNGDMFGASVAAIGDLDGDGVEDMAVGAPSQTGSGSAGGVFVQFMNADGTVKSSRQIASGGGGGPALSEGDYFGHSVAPVGDLDGDGVTDLAAGASKDDTGGYISGAVYVLFMNTDGTVKASQKIASGGGPTLSTGDRFGTAVSSIGDLDGDGVRDLAVGAAGDDTGGSYRGAVHVLFMNANGTVKASQKIASGIGGGPALTNLDFFGGAVTNLGDLDGDGVVELAVGASGDDTGGTGRGAVYILFMNAGGNVKSSRKIASGVGGGPVLGDGDYFGRSVSSLGDLDGDGITDLAVGAYRDDTGGASRGAVHILYLNANGTVKRSDKIAHATGGGPNLTNDDRFGSGIAALGDLDGDGVIELAVGAETDNTGGSDRGAVYTLFLKAENTSPVFTSPAAVSVPENSSAVMTVTASDADVPLQTVTISIVGGIDQDKFALTGNPSSIEFSGPIDYPGAVYTATSGVNDDRVVVGGIGLPGSPNPLQRGFVFDGSTYTLIHFPSSTNTGARDINNQGVIVGSYGLGTGVDYNAHGYILNNGVFTTIDYPGGRHTNLLGINAHGVVAGSYVDGNHKRRGFLFNGADFISVNYPGAVETFVQAISDSGLVVGSYDDGTNPFRGFLYDGSTYYPIDVPGAQWTVPSGVNSHGAVVGQYVIREAGVHIGHGFLFDGFEYHTINHPNGPQTTNLQDITDNWGIVGTYQAPDGLGPNHGFTATINKPAAPTLVFKAPPNYETPSDANGDNIYEVIVQASDGHGGTATQTIRVTVTPVNDNRPVITSADAVSVAENTTAVLTVTATDADLPLQAVSFAIIGGADQSRFDITTGGVLSFNTPPDFESPTDDNGDNVYIVIVEASDGSLPTVQAILVTVTNVVTEPLVGDYDNNGIVDLADYVLWRNGGPLQNEGASPGIVTQEDYGIWRANFGRTAPAPAAASVLAEITPRPDLVRDRERGFEIALSPPESQDVVSLPLPSSQSFPPARAAGRASSRAAFAARTERDDALIAWLTSRAAGMESNWASEPSGSALSEFVPAASARESEDAFELAFAALGSSAAEQ